VKVRLDVKRAWCVDGWIRKWNFGSITMHVGPSEHIHFQHKRTSHLPPTNTWPSNGRPDTMRLHHVGFVVVFFWMLDAGGFKLFRTVALPCHWGSDIIIITVLLQYHHRHHPSATSFIHPTLLCAGHRIRGHFDSSSPVPPPRPWRLREIRDSHLEPPPAHHQVQSSLPSHHIHLPLSLSLTHTHTHTHTPPPPAWPSRAHLNVGTGDLGPGEGAFLFFFFLLLSSDMFRLSEPLPILSLEP